MMTDHGVVLVGIDGSEVASAALEFAADEAHLRGAGLLVAHAGRSKPSTFEMEPAAEILRRDATARVSALHPHLDCHVVVRDTDPATMLVELSKAADLLVVGTHRTGRLRGWVLGSVSQFVAAHATCPVITISGVPENGAGPIVLGASTSPGGMAALHFACEEARLSGVPVHAVRSITTEDWALGGLGDEVLMGFEVMHDVAQAVLDKVLATAAESYPDVSISGEVSNANPFSDLLKASAGASMLVIGSRRSRSSALPHLGPVAAWLLHQATCPLAVVGYREG